MKAHRPGVAAMPLLATLPHLCSARRAARGHARPHRHAFVFGEEKVKGAAHHGVAVDGLLGDQGLEGVNQPTNGPRGGGDGAGSGSGVAFLGVQRPLQLDARDVGVGVSRVVPLVCGRKKLEGSSLRSSSTSTPSVTPRTP